MAQDFIKMKQRQIAALSALKFFTDKKNIKSSNIPGFESHEDSKIITAYREQHSKSIIGSFEDASRTGLGNSGELMSIVYASLVGNPRIYHNSLIAMCKIEGDHGIIIVTEKYTTLPIFRWCKLSELSLNTMVVDAWTRDCYFPNLDPVIAATHELDTPSLLSPWQMDVRLWCKIFPLRILTHVPILPVPKNPTVWPTGEYS